MIEKGFTDSFRYGVTAVYDSHTDVLDPIARPYTRAVGDDFVLMDDNA